MIITIVMERFLTQKQEKQNIMDFNKKMVVHLSEIKKSNEAVMEAQKSQKSEYQKKFEELMRKLEEDYSYDENKCKLVSEENAR